MKSKRGKTVVKLDIDSEVQMIRDNFGGGTAYQTKQVGGLFIASSIKQENASAFDPICGEVIGGEFNGLTAYFHKLCYREAQRYGNQNHLFDGKDIDMPDGKYLLIEDESIFFYVDKDMKIYTTPNWCLCEPINDWAYEYVDGVRVKSRVSTGGILIPVTNEEHKTDKAILRHISPKVSEELQLFAGDIVFLDKACDLPVEDDLNMKLDRKYFRVEVNNILGKECENSNTKNTTNTLPYLTE